MPEVVPDHEVAAAASGNLLLRSLPAAERRAVAARAELVAWQPDEVVYGPGEPDGAAYFPLDAVLAVGLREGVSGIDVVATGNEGLVGLSAFVGSLPDQESAICRVRGRGLRVPATELPRLVTDCPALDLRVRRYGSAVTAVLLQRVLCLRRHTRDACCACWLLQVSDRVGSLSFELTHVRLASMLSVRRATVTESAAALQRAGLIHYVRGRVSIVDRDGLVAVACGCYPAARRIFAAALA